MTALDTNVLIEIAEGAHADVADLIDFISLAPQPLVISPIVYAELCAHPGWKLDEVDAFLVGIGVRVHWNLSSEIWRSAGEANARYAARRRRSSASDARRIVADFIIGAHAATIGRFLTSDAAFFARNFPQLELLRPVRT